MSRQDRAYRLLSGVLFRVLPASVLALVAVWFAASMVTERTIEAEVHRAIDQEATHLANALAAELDLLVDATQALASNDLIVNGLADTVERNNYLPTLFNSLSMPGSAGASITLTDYVGRVIIDNGSGQS